MASSQQPAPKQPVSKPAATSQAASQSAATSTQFAIELAEFLRANPDALDSRWAALLADSDDPGIGLMVTALEAGALMAFEADSLQPAAREHLDNLLGTRR